MDYKAPVNPPPNYTATSVLASNNPYKKTQQSEEKSVDYQPPTGPPPSGIHDEQEPPPYDPWLTVPDNALLPPPPPMMESYSPANNASSADAERAEAWCRVNGLWKPRIWTIKDLEQMHARQYTLTAPPGSRHIKIKANRGRTLLTSSKRQEDITILSSLPLFAASHHQLKPGQTLKIYYQIVIKYMSGSDAAIALGFVAPPYPLGRLPGWHRGSLAVHNDDGRRFVNDDQGGSDFVRPFGVGETVGIGMSFTRSQCEGQSAAVRVYFTRNGHEEKSWNLHESRDVDAQAGGIDGLEGGTDLYAAIGVCGGVEIEVDWTG